MASSSFASSVTASGVTLVGDLGSCSVAVDPGDAVIAIDSELGPGAHHTA